MKRLLLILALLCAPALALAQATGPYGVFGGPIPSASLPPATKVPTNTYAFTTDQGLMYDNGSAWVAAGTGSGTVSSGTAGQVAIYSSTGSVVSGTSTPNVSGSYKIGGNNAIQFPGGDTSSVAVGNGAGGNAISTFGWNTAVGFNAMENSTACFGGSGSGYDVAIGWESLIGDAGCENTGVGVNTLLANTTGNFNVAIGNDAMSYSTTQSASIGIGHSACGGGASDGASTGSSNMCIGASAGGFMSGAASFNAFIGATSGQGTLGNQNTASDNTGIGWGTLQDLTTGTSNTCVGFAACEGSTSAPLTGAANTVLGANALELAQGSATHDNVAVGYNAMSAATGANYDSCIGDHACSGLISGYFDVVNGANAGTALTSGYANTLIGYAAAPTTLATGNDNLILTTGSSTCDTASASTSFTAEFCAGSTPFLTVTGANVPATSVATLPGVLAVKSFFNMELGQSQGNSSNWPGQLAETSLGTTGSPVSPAGPVVKISKTENYASSSTCNGNVVDSQCNAALLVVSVGQGANVEQTTAIVGAAYTTSTGCSGCTALGGVFTAELEGSAVGGANGVYIQGRRDTTTGTAKGGEIRTQNNTSTNCNVSYIANGQCDGFWMTAQSDGTNPTSLSSALHVGITGSNINGWTEGVTLNPLSVTTIGFDDDSSSTTAFEAQSGHTTAFASPNFSVNGSSGALTTPSINATGALSSAFGTTGTGIFTSAQTQTDSTTGAGTVASSYFHNIAVPTLATSANAITVTNAYTFDIAGCPTAGTNVTITTCGALRVGSGQATFNGLLVGGAGASIAGAQVSLNGSSNFNTNINTGTSTGTITIGNSSNTGKTTLAGLGAGTAADFVCVTSGGVAIQQTTPCLGGTLSGTSSSLGGSALLAGACSTTTVSITGATTAMGVVATPVTYPGAGNFWQAYVSSANTATVAICAAVADTPTASTYNVRVLQ